MLKKLTVKAIQSTKSYRYTSNSVSGTARSIQSIIRKVLWFKRAGIIAGICFVVLIIFVVIQTLFSVAQIFNGDAELDDIDIPSQITTNGAQVISDWETTFTAEQLEQIMALSVDVSPGLLQATLFLTEAPTDVIMEYVATRDLIFEEKPTTTITSYSNGDPSSESVVMKSYLVSARMYNGVHKFLYEDKTESSSYTTTVLVDKDTEDEEEAEYEEVTVTVTTITPTAVGEEWEKEYSHFHSFLSKSGFRTAEERLLIYGMAMKFDPTFYDAELSPIYAELFGGYGKRNVMAALPPEEITAALKEAIRLAGVDEGTWLADMQQLVMRESGGRPDAYNETSVFYSAKWGYQNAHGLCQMMPPTFLAHHIPGYDDIWDPVDNAAAAIKYILGKYGHVSNISGLYETDYKGY